MTTPHPTLLSINNYHYFRGGAEAVFLRHNELFRDQGWNVVPFCMQHPQNLDSKWSRYFVDEIELGNDYSPVQKARMALKTIYSFEARRKVSRLIDEVKPDVCHAHNIYHHISPAILSTIKDHGIPIVMTLHDLKIVCPAYKMLNSNGVCEECKGGRLRRVVANRCIKDSLVLSSLVYLESTLHRLLDSYEKNVDVFVVPSLFLAQKLTEWGVDSKKLVHVPNFVDVDQFSESTDFTGPVTYFGRLADEKGIDTLIRAAARTGVAVRIIGTGPEEERLASLAAELAAPVEFCGYRSGPALPALLGDAKAIAVPSEWYENAPMSILESFAMGKPVVGARIGGIPEMVIDGRTGLLFESGSVDSLAEALLRVRDSEASDLSGLGRNARDLASEHYSAQRYVDTISQVYGTYCGLENPPGRDPKLAFGRD